MRSLPLLLPAFGLMAFWYWASHAPERFRWAARRPSPAVACWLLMGALLVLALNNIWKLPPYVGFDVNGHLAYMLFIIHNGRLPLAHEGWQMFQSPLYYLLSLPLAESMVNSMDLENLKKLLRIIPLLCGIAQVAVCYSAVRMVFPARRDLQICGTIVGGLLPMNIYISQYIGNEPLAGVLTSLTICMALAVVYGSARCRSRWWIALLGAVYGLALLAKVTPIVLAPILVGWLIVMPWLRAESALVGLKRAGLMCVIAGLCCGWYYWRNYAEFGRFFIGGWDSARSIEWWQDPGYRTLGELSRFGQSLRHPIYASVSGLWDSLYSTMWTDGSISSSARYKGSPPWNESFLVGGVLLSIVPQVLMLCGAAAGCIWKLMPNRGAIVLCVICVGAYLAAITGLYLKVPIYSTAKATYALGLLPCFAILVTAGLEVVARTIASRAFLYGLIAAWAVGAYATFFIVL